MDVLQGQGESDMTEVASTNRDVSDSKRRDRMSKNTFMFFKSIRRKNI
jgi:hypothetical protein